MKRLLLSLFLILPVTFPPALAAQHATECDRLTAIPCDRNRPEGVAGLEFKDIDAKRAVIACEQEVARDAGNPRYQFLLGRSLHKAQRFPEAVKWYRLAAEQDFSPAQNNIGVLYFWGLGVSQNSLEAMKRFRKAAEQSYSPAQYWLGRVYLRGKVVKRDDMRTLMWFTVAFTQGFEKAALLRDTVATGMTPTQIADAQRMAREWLNAHPL